ncbi:bacteriocin [Delftia acidovorans]|jgi:hypothetical protein
MTSSISLKYLLGRPVDPDLAEQAVQGHGVPSQDPDPSAQIRMTKEESARESRSTMVAGFMMLGAVVGAGVGAVAAGPVGIFVGGALGGLIGAGAGEAAGMATVAREA